MTDRNTALEDVAALMLERQKYESWLSSLDARRASTPDHVFTRVRGDYAARLKDVTDRLLKHRNALAQHLEILTARLATVEKDAQRLRDKRSEAELRMQVGELSVPDWNALARQCDDGAVRLSEEQTQIRTQLGQAKEILAMVAGQAGGTPTASPRQTRTSRPVAAEEVRAGEAASNDSPPARATPHSSMNELEFLKTVVGQPGEAPAQGASGSVRPTPNGSQRRTAPTPSAPRSVEPARPAEPPPTPAPAPPSPDAVKVDPDGAEDLAESLLSRVKSGGSTLREETDAESLLNETKKPASMRPLPTGNGSKATGNNPAVPRPGASGDRHKTLKCGECGAMNFPTEWYCERCGAELSAV